MSDNASASGAQPSKEKDIYDEEFPEFSDTPEDREPLNKVLLSVDKFTVLVKIWRLGTGSNESPFSLIPIVSSNNLGHKIAAHKGTN